MKFVKSHGGAVLITILIVALSILFGAHRSLTAEREKVESLFYGGAGGNEACIAADLDVVAGIGANLAKVAVRYLPADDVQKLEESRNMLLDWHGVNSAYTAYTKLMEEADAVLAKLEGSALSEQDAAYIQGFQVDLKARADMISRDPYNQSAEAFNSVILGTFPSSFLAKITLVRPASIFH